MESSAAPEQVETLFVQKEERPLFPGVTPDSSETQPDKGEKMKNQIPLGHPHDLSTDSRLSRQFLLAVLLFCSMAVSSLAREAPGGPLSSGTAGSATGPAAS